MRTVMPGLDGLDTRSGFSAFALCILNCLLLALPPASVAAPAETDLFNGTNVVRINITVPTEGVRVLQHYFWGNSGQDKPEAKATVTEGERVYKNVAVHLKGAAGSFRPFGDKPGLTLNFDKFVPGQKFHGLQKISLNNSVQDPTFICEKICREAFEAAGVPVPRADYALVTLNGRNLGLYVLLEGYNKQFLKRHFKDVSGNLYDGGFCREITDGLNVNSGDKPNDRSDLHRLASAAAAARENNSLTELSKILDIDRFLTFVAMEVILCHWDGYTMNRNNYRLYHSMDNGKMIFMPHGLDQMFGMGDRGSPQDPIVPSMNGFVASAVIGTSEGRTRYLQRLAELRTNIFKVEALTNRVREIEERIRPYLNESRYFSRRRTTVDWLCQNIAARAENLDQQLVAQPKPAVFTNSILRLSNWQARNASGNARLDLAASKDGKELLHIAAANDGVSSSWRTRVLLPRGRYRIEGYARTRGSDPSGEGGALLRISGTMSQPVLRGSSEWVMLSYPFEVLDSSRDVQIICELKGKGEAWFDTTSLKIRRTE